MKTPDKYALAVTYAVAAGGVGVFYLLSLPLPWLLGPLFGCLIAALAGVKLTVWKPLGDTMRTILGLAIGFSITPALFSQLPALAGSIALVPLFIIVIALVGVPYFRWLGFDRPTSYYGAMPGGLQDMLVFGEEAGGDVRAMSLMQATRVMIIVSFLPIILTLGMEQTLDQPLGAPIITLPLWELGLMFAAGLLGWRIFLMLGVFGASILGPMVFAAALSLGGIVTHRPPNEAILLAQFFVGMAVGVKYVGLTFGELRRVVAASVGYCVVLGLVSFVFVNAVLKLGLLPPVEAILAFAPGGQAEMAILALASGAEVAVIVAHHVVRILIVIIGAPIVSKLIR
ncbi:AbrB family transcriptional regulator [Parasulfitobacter algicola]|uniref:AbrB family transcriptional regulator n=1 Tax=Parasulfitobacter algicola TaxID=2614809 RepID=A0ABX2IZ24_9RHOB|nr:AbrB family transcriptional regulator [Sulfitobacter algicola]NSX55843.1 AbrB family transcriptional regulator [Sulfitobacter algicola]